MARDSSDYHRSIHALYLAVLLHCLALCFRCHRSAPESDYYWPEHRIGNRPERNARVYCIAAQLTRTLHPNAHARGTRRTQSVASEARGRDHSSARTHTHMRTHPTTSLGVFNFRAIHTLVYVLWVCSPRRPMRAKRCLFPWDISISPKRWLDRILRQPPEHAHQPKNEPRCRTVWDSKGQRNRRHIGIESDCHNCGGKRSEQSAGDNVQPPSIQPPPAHENVSKRSREKSNNVGNLGEARVD